MKKYIKLLGILCLFAILISTVSMLSVSAASTSIAISSRTLKPGDTLTVTVTINGGEQMYATEAYLSYNPECLRFDSGESATGEGGQVHIIGVPAGASSQSYTLNFTAFAEGQSMLNLRNVLYVGAGEDDIPVTGSSVSGITVKSATSSKPSSQVSDPVSVSNDATLVALSVSGAELTPSFSKSVTNYTALVKYNVDKVTLSATAAGGATFTGAGTFDLEIGNNSHTVTVTAADGKTKISYTVNIRRMTEEETKEYEETNGKNPLMVKCEGKDLMITADIASLGVYQNFSVGTVKRGETEVSVLKDDKGVYTLYYLVDSDGNGGYYSAINSENFEKLNYIIIGSKMYIVNKLPSNTYLASGYKNAVLKLGDQSIPAIQFENDNAKDIYIVYCYENGKCGYYRYDVLDKTLSRAPEFSGVLSGKRPDENNKAKPGILKRFNSLTNEAKIIMILIFATVISIIAIVVLMIIKYVNGRSKKQKNQDTAVYDNELSEDTVTDDETIIK